MKNELKQIIEITFSSAFNGMHALDVGMDTLNFGMDTLDVGMDTLDVGMDKLDVSCTNNSFAV